MLCSKKHSSVELVFAQCPTLREIFGTAVLHFSSVVLLILPSKNAEAVSLLLYMQSATLQQFFAVNKRRVFPGSGPDGVRVMLETA